MTEAPAGLAPRRRRALDGHVAACPACRDETVVTGRLLAALDRLPAEAPVPASLEQATLRRIRLAAAEEEAAASHRRLWWRVAGPAFALATAAGVALVVGRLPTATAPPVASEATRPATERVARAPAARPAAPAAPAGRPAAVPPPASDPPPEPPPELAAAPDLFMDLPILRNLEKLRNFEAIRTTTVDDSPHVIDGREEESG